MAILEPVDGWAIDQALPPMLEELGCRAVTLEDPALCLARQRARCTLNSDEDPLQVHAVLLSAYGGGNYPDELIELGYFDDEDIFFSDDPEEKRTRAREALQDLLSPELRQQRLVERTAAWEQEQTRIKANGLTF